MTKVRLSQDAFNDAIDNSILSTDPNADNFAGYYMYMFTEDNRDAFKHIDTRTYLYNTN